MDNGAFKASNAMSLVPSHLQPNAVTDTNTDFVVWYEKAYKLLAGLKERETDTRIKLLKDQIKQFDTANKKGTEGNYRVADPRETMPISTTSMHKLTINVCVNFEN